MGKIRAEGNVTKYIDRQMDRIDSIIDHLFNGYFSSTLQAREPTKEASRARSQRIGYALDEVLGSLLPYTCLGAVIVENLPGTYEMIDDAEKIIERITIKKKGDKLQIKINTEGEENYAN